MSTLVAFDIGNVLCRVDLDPFCSAMSSISGVSKEEAYHFLEKNQYDMDVGRRALKEIIKYELNIKEWNLYSYNKIINSWLMCVTPIVEMQKLLKELAENNYKVALLSNIGYDHANYISNLDGFKSCIKHFSCEVGIRKPSKLFFQSFLMEYPEFIGASYFDDKIENINSAAAIGFDAIQFDLNTKNSNELAANEIRKIILK